MARAMPSTTAVVSPDRAVGSTTLQVVRHWRLDQGAHRPGHRAADLGHEQRGEQAERHSQRRGDPHLLQRPDHRVQHPAAGQRIQRAGERHGVAEEVEMPQSRFAAEDGVSDLIEDHRDDEHPGADHHRGDDPVGDGTPPPDQRGHRAVEGEEEHVPQRPEPERAAQREDALVDQPGHREGSGRRAEQGGGAVEGEGAYLDAPFRRRWAGGAVQGGGPFRRRLRRRR
jgi:hypothetical protein